MADRPDVPPEWIQRLSDLFDTLPEAYQERAWVGTRWRVGQATIAHVFGGEDQLFRVVFRAELGEVMVFEHSGPPYFKAGWGDNVVGIVLDESTDWEELGEMLTESYCLQAPKHLAGQVIGGTRSSGDAQ
ncbi:MmcQ/YjbR family DNA-binding protein [Ornithinimicrobium faecis]|uniref:MmcQ/YjbR family DNA-binding protein n=1 Tax=Ornithinimicrobium faecis TaxID=2934158 RepID=A0ABY4YN29_9MICO|nr:MmcQ/YjbR family DNA-binding protein [Ornithinimicrobium sp. HY1793]USQ78159.1 MmcQ/YjbR family DNA-binding protein [Ornithinimicrobium sp. HY1793]